MNKDDCDYKDPNWGSDMNVRARDNVCKCCCCDFKTCGGWEKKGKKWRK